MSRKRTATGAQDEAWLKEALNNPNISVVDKQSGQQIQSEKDLKTLIEEDQQAAKEQAKADQQAADPTIENNAAQDKAAAQKDKAEQLNSETPGATKKEQAAQKKAQREADQKQREAERAAAQAKADQARRQTAKQRLIGKINDKTAPWLDRAGLVADRIANAPTVGGIGLLIVVLIFLIFVVVVVNQAGDTRIKQLWYMLSGRAHLEGHTTPIAGSGDVGGGASADFNGSSNSSSSSASTTTPAASSNTVLSPGYGHSAGGGF